MPRLGRVIDSLIHNVAVTALVLAQQTPSSSELAGKFLWESATIQEPVACAVSHAGVVLVADAQGALVALSAADGSQQWRVDRAGDERFVEPSGVGLLNDGSVIVADARRVRVDRFSPKGEWIGHFAESVPLKRPGQIAVLDGGSADRASIAIVDTTANAIHLCNQTGEFIASVSGELLVQPGSAHASPTGVAFVAPDQLVVCCADQDRVFLVDIADPMNCAAKETWGGRGPFPGMLNRPMSVAYCDGWIWCADQFNHRISRHDLKGKGQLAYGQHAVRPREGSGAVHYPVAIGMTDRVDRLGVNGPLAVVCEPFERRVQAFVPSSATEPLDMRLVLPKLDGVQSHFGAASARDGERFFMQDPESCAIVGFDLSRGQPLHVTNIGAAGSKPHEFGRIDAMLALNGGTRLLVADGVSRRLALWELTAPPKEIVFEPFMAKLVKTRPYERLPISQGSIVSSLARGSSGEIIALCSDGPSLVILDSALRTAQSVAIPAPDSTARAVAVAALSDGTVGVLFDRPAAVIFMRKAEPQGSADVPVQWSSTGSRSLPNVIEGAGLTANTADEWVVLDRQGDCVEICAGDGTSRRIGSRGVADSQFWLPGAVSIASDGTMYVVDSGNHRAQKFSSDGQWQMTFSLGRSYTRARTADEVLRVKKKAPTGQREGAK